MARLFATTSPEISEREKRNMERSRRIASQGMVLLLNRGALPIEKPGKIALFGSGARWTVKGGTGSGDVNSRFVVNVEKGLEEAKAAYGEALREAVEKKGVMPILYIFKRTGDFHDHKGGLREGGCGYCALCDLTQFRGRKGQKAGVRGI